MLERNEDRTPSPERDFLLWRRDGNPAALGRVFGRLAPELLIVAAHVADRGAAQDLVQTPFLHAIDRGRIRVVDERGRRLVDDRLSGHRRVGGATPVLERQAAVVELYDAEPGSSSSGEVGGPPRARRRYRTQRRSTSSSRLLAGRMPTAGPRPPWSPRQAERARQGGLAKPPPRTAVSPDLGWRCPDPFSGRRK